MSMNTWNRLVLTIGKITLTVGIVAALVGVDHLLGSER
jgi:flagellar motor component MotA